MSETKGTAMKRPLRKFRMDPKYPHLRSEGLSSRRFKGAALVVPAGSRPVLSGAELTRLFAGVTS